MVASLSPIRYGQPSCKNNGSTLVHTFTQSFQSKTLVSTTLSFFSFSQRAGVQAVSASDYAIGQFRFLQRLLLVHGAQAYSRICVLILYSFYKNFVISFGHLFFAFYSAFSAQVSKHARCCVALYISRFSAISRFTRAIMFRCTKRSRCSFCVKRESSHHF